MTKETKIIKLYKEKIQKLLKFNKAYFEKDNPIISDFEFDELKKELFQLVKKYSFLKKILFVSLIKQEVQYLFFHPEFAHNNL